MLYLVFFYWSPHNDTKLLFSETMARSHIINTEKYNQEPSFSIPTVL